MVLPFLGKKPFPEKNEFQMGNLGRKLIVMVEVAANTTSSGTA
jgi:hypothetical protein